MLISAIIFITAALVFYSTAVWWERILGFLRGWHILLFWIGLVCDTTGTALMEKLAGGTFQLNFHGITGLLAVILMLFHALWGTIVHAGKNPEPKQSFHKFSLVVWAIWLIPYLSGMVFGMSIH
jgi:TIGR03987 family protein